MERDQFKKKKKYHPSVSHFPTWTIFYSFFGQSLGKTGKEGNFFFAQLKWDATEKKVFGGRNLIFIFLGL